MEEKQIEGTSERRKRRHEVDIMNIRKTNKKDVN